MKRDICVVFLKRVVAMCVCWNRQLLGKMDWLKTVNLCVAACGRLEFLACGPLFVCVCCVTSLNFPRDVLVDLIAG
jgi:hypothetical protein